MLADAAAEVTGVERLRPAFGELLERGSEIRHHEPVARDERNTARAEDLVTDLRAPQDQIEDAVQVGLRRDEFVPVAGNRNRRLEQAAPRQPRVRAMRRLEPGDRTRHGARGAPDTKDL